MKKKISIGLVIVAILVALYFILFPTRISDQGGLTNATPKTEQPLIKEEIVTDIVEQVDESALRLEQMKMVYAKLEESRNRLKGRLGIIKARTWNLELSPEQAGEINKEVNRSYVLLKNPPLLGAFSSVEEIEKGIRKLEAIHNKLDKAEEVITVAIGSK